MVVFLAWASAAQAQTTLRATVYASGFSSPLTFVQDPADPTLQYVVEQVGRIRVIHNGGVVSTNFLDLSGVISSGGERGLLGLAFAPDYATSGRFNVNFTDTSGDTVVARFIRSSIPTVADPSSRFDLQLEGTRRF